MLTFQWAYNNVGWTSSYADIAGATDTLYVVSATNYNSDSYFVCKQVCAGSPKVTIPADMQRCG